jgi:hypothetical protein
MLEIPEAGQAILKNDYFQKGAQEYHKFTDYATKDHVVTAKNYEWTWTLGEIVTAFCQSRMRIEFLHEFPQYFYSGYTGYDVEANKRELYPCTFSLKVIAD